MPRYKTEKTIVVSLGGSIVYPDQIDTAFLKKFNSFIRKFLKKGHKFVIVVGGGKLCRNFQNAATEISRAQPRANSRQRFGIGVNDEDKDWIGIHATRLNAHLLRTIFRDVADPEIIDSEKKSLERAKHHSKSKLKYKVTIGAGWRPGWSTDYIAAHVARDFKIKEFINAGKPAYVFEKDPKKFPKAKYFENLSWSKYRKLIPSKWIPGFSSPVDPIAAKLCQKEKMKAVVINGKDLKNFENLLTGKNFNGTIIS